MLRYAQPQDIPRLMALLDQVDRVHHAGRPDLFRIGTKYDPRQLTDLLQDPSRPILVDTDQQDVVQGYCFCIIQQHLNDPILTDVKTLYIDDLCVDADCRGKGVGKRLYKRAVTLAKELNCYNLTLNVWSCNPSALAFYEAMGLVPQKIGMEYIL